MTWNRTRSARNMDWLKLRVAVNPATGCWEWKLTRSKLGYGQYGDTTGTKHVTRKAHRLAFELANGHLPGVVMHRCDNPPCCNPAHLSDGTLSDNTQDMLAKGRSAQAKLSPAQAEEIRTALAHGAKGAHLARFYGVSETAISRIKRGRTWLRPEDRPPTDGPPPQCPMCQQPVGQPNATYCSARCRHAAFRLRRGQKPRARRSPVSAE